MSAREDVAREAGPDAADAPDELTAAFWQATAGGKACAMPAPCAGQAGASAAAGARTCAFAERAPMGEAPSGADTCAIIVAGGSGARFGDPRGKQFVELCGLPILAWSVLALDRAPSVGHIVIACPHGQLDRVRTDVLAGLTLRVEVTLVPGGATRQDSVFAGLVAAPPDFDLVAIHDGARPLVEPEAVERCIQAVRADESLAGAILASRQTDTLKLVDATGVIMATPDRSNYWCAQTPQVFRARQVMAAHKAAVWDDFEGTDDASLVEHRGGRVRVVESSRDNIKVTVPEDLALAEATLARRIEQGR